MDVAIVSDTHFGFKWDSEREEDAFRNAREAFRRTRDADLVILPGDIFDRKVPKQEVLARAVDCFSVYREGENTLEIAEDSDVTQSFTGTPVVAIHGTHERRSEQFTNPVELLEKMDYLLHLHNEKAVFEKDGEKVAVHGMSGVPERYAPKVLEKFGPEPVEGAFNIFVFHQSVEGLVYTSQDHDHLKMEHLPDGFDLLVDGHIHWHRHLEDENLVLPGSTVSTQMRKIEAEQPKGFVTVNTGTGELAVEPLETPRDLFYEEIDVEGMSGTEVMETVRERMDPICNREFDTKPLVRLILEGESSAAVTQSDIEEMYGDDAILSVSVNLERQISDSGATAIDDERDAQDMGMALLKERVDRDIRLEDLFQLLSDGAVDEAVEMVTDMAVEQGDGEVEEKEEEDGAARQQDAGRRTLTEF